MGGKILPVYFFPGPELGEKRARIQKIQQALTGPDGQPPELCRYFPYETGAVDVVAVLRNGALFASRRMVIVSDSHALKAADIALFREYFSSPSPDAVLIFTTEKGPGTREYPDALARALPKNAVEVFWEMFETNRRGWILKFFRERGLRVDAEAVDLLLDLTGGTTDALREACDLLAFSAEEGKVIGEEDADSVLEHTRDETVYTLFDRLCRRDLASAVDTYRKILHTEPSMADRVASLLLTPLLQLRDFKMMVSRSYSGEDAARELKLRGGKRALRSYKTGAGNFLLEELDEAVNQLIDLEAWLRTAPRELREVKTELWMCRVLRSRPHLRQQALAKQALPAQLLEGLRAHGRAG